MKSMQARGRKPQLFMFHILVRKVTIETGKDQNYDPTLRKLEGEEVKQEQGVENQPLTADGVQKSGEKEEKDEISESEVEDEDEKEEETTEEDEDEIEKDGQKGGGKKKGGKKGGGKKGGGKKGGGKKKKKSKHEKIKHSFLTPLPLPPPPFYKLLPPFSLGFRIFDDELQYLEQIVLPAEPVPAPPLPKPTKKSEVIPLPPRESKEVPKISVRQTKTTIQEPPTAKIPISRGMHRPKSSRYDKNKKGEKKKSIKKQEEVSRPVSPPCPYSPEELHWKLADEKWFGRGLLLVVSKSADDVISWVQRGYMSVDVCRWKGYGERDKIATASVCLPSRMAEIALRATNKEEPLPLIVNCEGEAKIRDLDRSEIGNLYVEMTLTCYGDSWSSPLLLSSCGLEAMLSSCPLVKSDAEEKRRKELDDMYDISNLIELLRVQKDRSARLNLPITFEDIMCAMC